MPAFPTAWASFRTASGRRSSTPKPWAAVRSTAWQGFLAPSIQVNLARIDHMQLADNPGRHEPGTGEINYPFLFDFIDGLGYEGWIGCEYKPAAATVDGLDWIRPYLG